MFKQLKEWNDLKDELERVKDYGELLEEQREVMRDFPGRHNVRYLLLVGSNARTRYTGRLVSVRDTKVLFTISYDMDARALQMHAIRQRPQYLHMNSNVRYSRQYFHFRFANFLVKVLKGGGEQ